MKQRKQGLKELKKKRIKNKKRAEEEWGGASKHLSAKGVGSFLQDWGGGGVVQEESIQI